MQGRLCVGVLTGTMTPQQDGHPPLEHGDQLSVLKVTARAIELDDIETWPRACVDLLERHLDTVVKYAAFDRGRYADHELGVSLNELSVRPNPFEAQRTALFDELVAMLRTEKFIAYHCTRLTESEMEAMICNGLACLTGAHLRERLARRADAGDITAEDMERLLDRARARMTEWPEGRAGKIWAVPSPRPLADPDELGNPLIYWGGEAILSLVHADRYKLANIGLPCIVVFNVRVDKLVNTPLAESMANRLLHLRHGGAEDDVCDLCIAGSIPALDIRKVVRRGDPAFEEFTSCSSWDVVLG